MQFGDAPGPQGENLPVAECMQAGNRSRSIGRGDPDAGGHGEHAGAPPPHIHRCLNGKRLLRAGGNAETTTVTGGLVQFRLVARQ